jgi:VWFA-related protein
MPARHLVVFFFAGILAGILPVSPRAQSSQQGVFRGGTTLIPVDVRVLDRDGRPVRDLTAADFVVSENGVPQTIRHFSAHALTPDTGAAGSPLRRTTPESLVTPPNRRVFLIVLGRGRLKEVSRGLDAVEAFVRERLLPQDQIAVMAWNRATHFTTDHASVLAMLGRYRERHEQIESDLRLYFTGLTGLYARALPDYAQARIDAVFYGDGPAAREVLTDELDRATRDVRRLADRQLAISIAAFNRSDVRLAELTEAETLGKNFDDYVALSRQSMHDFGNLLAGVEYLRYVEGEKRIVFMTEHGFVMPSADYDRDLGAIAADARVAVDTIQTGGVDAVGIGSDFGVPQSVNAALSSLRTVAETTGGQHSVSRYAGEAFDRILAATEFGYVLGYTPTRPVAEGGFRPIRVEVKRRGVSVSYRRGYFARVEEPTFDPRRIMAIARLNAAASHGGDIKDLKLTIKGTDVREGRQNFVDVETTIAADRIGFGLIEGRHVAALSQVILATDQEGRSEGSLTRTFDMSVSPALLDQVRQTGLKTTVRLPVTKPPIFVTVIIYDYGSDRLGRTGIRMH